MKACLRGPAVRLLTHAVRTSLAVSLLTYAVCTWQVDEAKRAAEESRLAPPKPAAKKQLKSARPAAGGGFHKIAIRKPGEAVAESSRSAAADGDAEVADMPKRRLSSVGSSAHAVKSKSGAGSMVSAINSFGLPGRSKKASSSHGPSS